MKHSVKFWILFFVFLPISTYMYFYTYSIVIPWQTSTMVKILAVLFYLVAIIPLTAYISEKIAT